MSYLCYVFIPKAESITNAVFVKGLDPRETKKDPSVFGLLCAVCACIWNPGDHISEMELMILELEDS